jgi:methylenetetrahydrofolate reductase (NADPH)
MAVGTASGRGATARAELSERIGSTLGQIKRPIAVSFEFFPPGDEQMEQTLWQSVERLAPLRPRFVSVTYGADGSTRERTHNVVRRVLNETTLTPAPHLTCVGASRESVLATALDYWHLGVRNIVALRGDPPQGSERYRPHPGGFAYAVDLVRALHSVGGFDICVAAYPEKHPEAADAQADLDCLKAKLDAGASRAITQFFFDTAAFLRFRERCAASGLRAGLVPGILPFTRMPQMLRFAQRCGASVPAWLGERFAGLEDDPETRRLIAAAFAIGQVEELEREGVDEFHFYTLNRADLTYAICHALGVRS